MNLEPATEFGPFRVRLNNGRLFMYFTSPVKTIKYRLVLSKIWMPTLEMDRAIDGPIYFIYR